MKLISLAAECVPDRTDVQCLHRWQKVLDPELVKGPWKKEVIFLSVLHVANTNQFGMEAWLLLY